MLKRQTTKILVDAKSHKRKISRSGEHIRNEKGNNILNTKGKCVLYFTVCEFDENKNIATQHLQQRSGRAFGRKSTERTKKKHTHNDHEPMKLEILPPSSHLLLLFLFL